MGKVVLTLKHERPSIYYDLAKLTEEQKKEFRSIIVEHAHHKDSLKLLGEFFEKAGVQKVLIEHSYEEILELKELAKSTNIRGIISALETLDYEIGLKDLRGAISELKAIEEALK